MRLYLVTLNSDEHILIIAKNEESAKSYAFSVMEFGTWIKSVEFIAMVHDVYLEGEILKKF